MTATSFNVADAALTDTTPVATLNSSEGVSTGNVVIATFTDANPGEDGTNLSVTSINWGGATSGSPTTTIQLVSTSATQTTWQVVGNVTYTEAGTYNVSLTVKDSGGKSVTTSNTTISVADGTLTDSTAASVINATEGVDVGAGGPVTIATFTDNNPLANVADFNASVDWKGALVNGQPVSVQVVSNGVATATQSFWAVQIVHVTYAELSSNIIKVTVTDGDGASVVSSGLTTINVADAALTNTTAVTSHNATAGTATGTIVLATFTDANSFAAVADFTASINWGGAVSAASYSIQYNGVGNYWEVVANVTYVAAGNYNVTVRVDDTDGSFFTQNITFTVT
jgi:hypothetical protein